MDLNRRANDAVHLWTRELSARVVAESGIPSDQYHYGKLILQGLKDAPDYVLQIDAATGKSETFGSALQRSVTCARALTKMGLKRGDVMVLMAPNHLDVCIPYYAAFYLGITVATIDRLLTTNELKQLFVADKPKIIFCQNEKLTDVVRAVKELSLDTDIVTFDEGSSADKNVRSFIQLMNQVDNQSDVKDFRPTDFDPEETLALLISTSGTTGVPKRAAVSHKCLAITAPYLWARFTKFPTPTRLAMIVSPIQWVTCLMHFNSGPILRYTRLQSSVDVTREDAYNMINKYKPTFMFLSPTFMTTLIKPGIRDKCDFTCFEHIYMGGSAVSEELIHEVKKATKNTEVVRGYGLSEVANFALSPVPRPMCAGAPFGHILYRLVNTETLEDIVAPNVPGELWISGPALVKEYYANPEATKEAFRKDGWFRTGDVFYVDDSYNFYYVEKLKLLLKYKNHQVSPNELENLIIQHPGVLDVAVAGIPDPECGDLIVACVVRKPGSQVTAQEIKDLVKKNLTDTKQLRGGVIFLKEMPLTRTGKLNRQEIKKLVLQLKKE